MADPEPEPEDKSEQGGSPKPSKRGKAPKIALPKIALPTADMGVLAGGTAIALLSAGASVLAVHLFLPLREVQLVRNPHAEAVGRSFDRSGVPGITVGPDAANDYVSNTTTPQVANSAFINPQADVLGDVEIGQRVFVAPQASVRGDVGQGIHIGKDSAVLDGAVVEGRPTEERGLALPPDQVLAHGRRYSVYLGDRVTVAAQAQIYGPAIVSDGTYIGPQALVDHAMIGKGCVLEPRSAVIGVVVGDGRYVPAGDVVRDQTSADILPLVTGTYPYSDTDDKAVRVDRELAESYDALYPRSVPSPGL